MKSALTMKRYAFFLLLYLFISGVPANSTLFTTPPDHYIVGNGPVSIYAADFNSDSIIDIATVNRYASNISILLNNGDGSFQSTPNFTYAVGNEPSDVYAIDLDSDNDIDLAIANEQSGSISILLNNGDGSFVHDGSYGNSAGASSVIAFDIDNDLDNDLIVANYHTSNIGIRLNNGSGEFAEFADHEYEVGLGASDVISFELDNDSLNAPDLAVVIHQFDVVYLFINNGNGTYQSLPDDTLYVGDGPVSAVASDFDNDEDVDLAIGHENSNYISILLNNGNGTFQDTINYPLGINPMALITSDLDLDGDDDIAVANEGSNSITVLLNNSDGSFLNFYTYSVGEKPRAIHLADLDGDNDYDLVAANRGSNSSGEEDSISVLFNTTNTTYQYLPGDANMFAGGWEPIVIGADVTYLVNYFRSISSPCIIDGFYAAADANGDCMIIGSDVTFLVNYFRGLNPLYFCPDFFPKWPPLPSSAPSGWPNCD